MKRQTKASAPAWPLGIAALAIHLLGCADSTQEFHQSSDGSTQPPGDDVHDGGQEGGATAPLCVSSECASGHATCDDSTFLCDVDLMTDNDHCGACNIACPRDTDRHAQFLCISGQCQMQCLPYSSGPFGGGLPTADCNGLLDDGCEVILGQANNCGACGDICAEGTPCVRTALGDSYSYQCGCNPGQTYCEQGGGMCVDLKTDNNNCGGCGTVCPPGGSDEPNTHLGCDEGQCDKVECDVSSPSEIWVDCDGLTSNGCEINIGVDPSNCGGCGVTCDSDQSCVPYPSPARCLCPKGTKACRNNVCTDLLSDPNNCGGCDIVCPVGGGESGRTSAACVSGVCEIRCTDGFANCNHDSNDGCEVNLRVDQDHCGSCDNGCNRALDQPCQGGVCSTQTCETK